MNFHNLYDFISAERWARYLRTPEKVAEELDRNFADVDHVLEVGTAEGYVIRQLVQNDIVDSAVGYDLSKRRLRRGKQKIKAEGLDEKVHFCLGDGETLPFKDDSFDAVLLLQVLEHIPTREGVSKALAEARRVSRQGLLVALPLRDSRTDMIRYAKFLDSDHLRGLVQYRNAWIYHPENVEQFFEQEGFKFQRSRINDEFYVLR